MQGCRPRSSIALVRLAESVEYVSVRGEAALGLTTTAIDDLELTEAKIEQHLLRLRRAQFLGCHQKQANHTLLHRLP